MTDALATTTQPGDDPTWRLVQSFAASPLAPPELRGNPVDAYLIVKKGAEVGWSPLQSLDLINVIRGKVVVSAEGMVSLIRSAGHGIELVAVDETGCTVRGIRGDDTSPPMEVTYTIDMATRAGLVRKGGGWERNAEDMLWARAVSRLARWQFADVFTGHAYTPQDFGADHAPMDATLSADLTDNYVDAQTEEAAQKAEREPLIVDDPPIIDDDDPERPFA